MIELTPDHFCTALPLFSATHFGVLAAATLEGSHPGRVFVDREENPRAGLVCTRAGIGYYFLTGQPSAPVLDWLSAAFADDFVPAQKQALNNPEVLLFFDPPAWQEPLLARLADRKPILIRKKRMMLASEAFVALPDILTQLPSGLNLVSYTKDLLDAQPELSGEACLFYGSVEGFLKNGLGFCVLDESKVASQCQTVFTGCGEAEISIATAPEYRRRGLAQVSAAAFILDCQQRGLTPIWGCWPENTASVELARKLGFVEDVDQPVCLWVDSPEWGTA